jgi:hypothetical protein
MHKRLKSYSSNVETKVGAAPVPARNGFIELPDDILGNIVQFLAYKDVGKYFRLRICSF